MLKNQVGRFIASMVIAYVACLGLAAQEFRATMTGTVSDPSGAVVPGATVDAINNTSQQKYSTKTSSKGDYFIPYVLPGTYTVNVTAAGFKTQEQDNVILQAGESRGLNFALQVGASSQTVDVSATPALIDTANGSGGTVLTQREIENVPLTVARFTLCLEPLQAPSFCKLNSAPQAIPEHGAGTSQITTLLVEAFKVISSSP